MLTFCREDIPETYWLYNELECLLQDSASLVKSLRAINWKAESSNFKNPLKTGKEKNGYGSLFIKRVLNKLQISLS